MMSTDIKDAAWDSLSYKDKNRLLFERQKAMARKEKTTPEILAHLYHRRLQKWTFKH